MPIKAIKDIAKKNKAPLSKVERGFKEVATKAKEEGYKRPYAVAMAAAKNIKGKKKK